MVKWSNCKITYYFKISVNIVPSFLCFPFGSNKKAEEETGARGPDEGLGARGQFLLVSDPTDATMSVPEASPEQVRQVRRTANAARLL